MLIEPAVKNFQGGTITLIKQQVGNDATFGEIKLVMAWKEFENEKEKNVETG